MTVLDEEYLESPRLELLDTARAVLNGEIGLIYGGRKLQAFRFDLPDDLDPDFITFIGVDSETDQLPVDDEWRN